MKRENGRERSPLWQRLLGKHAAWIHGENTGAWGTCLLPPDPHFRLLFSPGFN